MKQFMNDTQGNIGFVESQRTYVEPIVNEVKHAAVQFPELVPVDTSANNWAKTVTYYSGEDIGRAEWINGNAGDMPMATREMTQHQTTVHMAGIGYGYGIEEIAAARQIGGNLPTDYAMAARRSFMYHVEDVVINGSAEKGFNGLIDNPSVATLAAPTGSWLNPNTTNQQILLDINQLLIGQAASTNFVEFSNVLLLPYEHWTALASRQNGDGNDTTTLEFVRKNNAYTAKTGQPLMIKALRELTTAGAGGTPRAIAYRKSPEVLKLHMPQPHIFTEVMKVSHMRYEVGGYFRLGGLDIRLPREVMYMDGI